MGLIRYLLGRTRYPDNEWTRARDGSPMRPYDMATDTMFEFMGVRVEPLDEAVKGKLVAVEPAQPPNHTVTVGTKAYALDGRLNDSFKAANILLEKGIALRRVDKPAAGLLAGDFIADSLSTAVLEEIARETGVSPTPLAGEAPQDVHKVKRLRVGLYQRYRGGNADEGWTRWLLEDFRFPFTSLLDAELKKGELNKKYDVIILPEDSTATLTGERSTDLKTVDADEAIPPKYRSGFGAEGTTALKAFVEQGGTLVTLGGAGNFAIDKLGLHVRNLTAGKSTKQFWCPGSTLKAKFRARVWSSSCTATPPSRSCPVHTMSGTRPSSATRIVICWKAAG
jgi:hypothetical protein